LLGRDFAAIEPVAKSSNRRAEAIIVPCDLTDPQQCSAAAEKTKAVYDGRIDILVNVAGGSGPIGKTGVRDHARGIRRDRHAQHERSFHTMRSVLPTMIAQRYGKIVNVGGTFGMRGRAGRMAYSASKWGLRGITKSFALEVGQYNINVNCVAPGMVDGPRFRDKVCADMAKRLGISIEEAAERHAAEYALKRVTVDQRRRQCLPVSRQRRLAPDHRRRSSGRRRLGDAVRMH
jgi:NAD(P)-dependent dehydrogenase (short-subunit alcohol dehydrogenase family)